MNSLELESAALAGQRLGRGEVESVTADGLTVVVHFDDEGREAWTCDVLQTSDRALDLIAGDQVVVWHASRADQRGVVLGRIGRRVTGPLPQPDAVPDELTLEAKHALTLRVGEGSITIREDGKILIKGKDLVSHAQRMNRIKGGAVAIN